MAVSETPTATIRTHRRFKGDAEDRWQCPKCGRKQSAFASELEAGKADCCNCGTEVTLVYRHFRGRKY